jgi:hypothetical protein
MIHWKRAVLLGFLAWAIPFAFGFMLFPIKETNAPLFSTLMNLVVLLTAGALIRFYFRRRGPVFTEVLCVGVLWFAMNLVFDYPMFAYGPMQMTPLAYYSEIGLGYLVFPIFAFWSVRIGS